MKRIIASVIVLFIALAAGGSALDRARNLRLSCRSKLLPLRKA